MTRAHDPDTDLLLRRAARGEEEARHRLLERHRGRLRRMIAVRLDPRLAARLDPSDIVQEALADADRKLEPTSPARRLRSSPGSAPLPGSRCSQRTGLTSGPRSRASNARG